MLQDTIKQWEENKHKLEDYLITHTYYGSCSGCDTLQGINSYSCELPTEEQVKDYMTLALHLVQRMHRIKDTTE